MVRDFNIDVNNYNLFNESLKKDIDIYNSKVEEYNKVAKAAYTRWYIIPITGKLKK